MIAELIRYAHKVKEAGLVVNSSGNISTRLSHNTFAISASGSCLGELQEVDIRTCYLDDPDKDEGPEPSMETPIHREIYLQRPDVKAILHFQSPYATTLACAKRVDFDLNFIPEVPVYLKNIKVIPYANPGSELLTEEVREKIMGHDCNIIVLLNHGQFAIGENLKSVLRSAELFEFACRLKCQGTELRPLSPKVVKELQNFDKA